MSKFTPSFCFQSPAGSKGYWQLPQFRVGGRNQDQQWKARSVQALHGSSACPQGFLSIWKQFDTLVNNTETSKQTKKTHQQNQQK